MFSSILSFLLTETLLCSVQFCSSCWRKHYCVQFSSLLPADGNITVFSSVLSFLLTETLLCSVQFSSSCWRKHYCVQFSSLLPADGNITVFRRPVRSFKGTIFLWTSFAQQQEEIEIKTLKQSFCTLSSVSLVTAGLVANNYGSCSRSPVLHAPPHWDWARRLRAHVTRGQRSKRAREAIGRAVTLDNGFFIQSR